jgi:hypothetical protein
MADHSEYRHIHPPASVDAVENGRRRGRMTNAKLLISAARKAPVIALSHFMISSIILHVFHFNGLRRRAPVTVPQIKTLPLTGREKTTVRL